SLSFGIWPISLLLSFGIWPISLFWFGIQPIPFFLFGILFLLLLLFAFVFCIHSSSHASASVFALSLVPFLHSTMSFALSFFWELRFSSFFYLSISISFAFDDVVCVSVSFLET